MLDQKLVDKNNAKIRETLSKVGEGPWSKENDRVEFKNAGLTCLIQRNSLGAWCGYVGIPSSHRFYKKHYDTVDVEVEVHGGLTYSGECAGVICHKTEKLWWFGFDCAHYMDFIPTFCKIGKDIYRDQRYVTEQTMSLAEQLDKKDRIINRIMNYFRSFL